MIFTFILFEIRELLIISKNKRNINMAIYDKCFGGQAGKKIGIFAKRLLGGF